MSSPWISALRSVAVNVPDLQQAEDFYTRVWHLQVADRSPDALWLRATGADHHVLALYRSMGTPSIRHVTLRARDLEALAAIEKAVVEAGGSVVRPAGAASDPAGGVSLTIADADGRRFEIVHGDRLAESPAHERDRPERLAHVVMNSHDVTATQHFLERALGFSMTDRTANMAFMNCNADHHSIGIHVGDNDALNHLAFLMPGVDDVMRGGGRLKDAGHAVEWGPGRHGPGNNAFNYFVDPFGLVIEYTAEVEQIDETYVPGTPSDWGWPAGRYDQWGLSQPPSARLKAAQRQIFFASSPAR